LFLWYSLKVTIFANKYNDRHDISITDLRYLIIGH
jgi:hypothetical protein